jgi:hypothetical protein
VRRLALALAALGASVAAAQEAPPSVPPPVLDLAEYRAELEGVAAALEAGDWESARAGASALRGAVVATDGSEFEADPSLLAAVAGARDGAGAARARLRVLAVLASLGDADLAGAEADAARLARLAREEAARRPRAGGEIHASLDVRPPTLPERLRQWLDRAMGWAWDLLSALWDWLTRMGPRRAEGRSGATPGIVGALVATIAAVLAFAAVRSMRRRDAAEEHGEAGEELAERDADPLSREAAEWERYAGELAAAGRRREAIRAWYHAVLVALFRAGRLLHQKGRTNWEYVAQAAPEAAWRAPLAGLTEVFDREWYGREASAPEALRECAARAREVLRSVRGEATP